MATDAIRKATKKYDEKFVKVCIRLTPEQKKMLDEKTQSLGKSINQLIIDLITNA